MKSLNRLLDNEDRKELDSNFKNYFWLNIPEMMSRKIDRANVQQYFVYQTVCNLSPDINSKVLCAGCHEDTAYEMLKLKYTNIVGIDPVINVDLATYTQVQFPETFDCIFSTSVLEHVKNDTEFINNICRLLKPSGCGILTVDFDNSYIPGKRLPYTDLRFYTLQSMQKLQKILEEQNCNLLGEPRWDGQPDFEYDGCKYSFASLVFVKE